MPLKVLFNIHLYFPRHACGGERYIHNINRYLVSKGHQVRIVLNQAAMHNVQVPYSYEGVDVFGPMGTVDQFNWADVLVSHLDYSHHTAQLAQVLKKPYVHIVHNSHPYECIKNAQKGTQVIYNSRWIADKLAYQHPSIVFTPPVDYRLYDLGKDPRKNEYITLINLDENKGGWILRKLAMAMPDKKFMAVKGSYSEPSYLGQCTDMPPNVTIVANNPNIMPVYEQTRILLMLSRYESWGMTATEAMCNGIPVLATPTPGLRENLGGAGIYLPERLTPTKDSAGMITRTDADDYDIGPLVKQINKLDKEPKYYKTISDLCRERSRELDPQKGLAEVEQFLYSAVAAGKQAPKQQPYRRMNLI